MKVLHLDSGRDWRGGQQQLFHLAAGLKKSSVDQELILANGTAFVDRMAELDVPLLLLPLRSEIDRASISGLRQLIRRFRPDIIHTHDARTLGLIAAATWLRPDRRVIAARRVAFPLKANLLTRLKYRRVPSRIIAVSHFVRKVLLAGGIDAQSVDVVYDGIDWQKLGSTVTRMEARRRFGVPENAYLVGCVGHFTAEKGHGLLIRAFADLAAASPKAQLLLVGDGVLREQYLRQVQDLNLEKAIHFAGFVADLENVWPALDLFVFPSLQEGLGSSLLAAMAGGVPVCASQSGGIPEIVTHGDTGYLFAPGDSEALVSTLIAAIGNDQKTREMGRAASRVVRNRFTTDRMVRETYEVYTNVLGD